MTTFDTDYVVLRYLRRLDKAAAAQHLPYTCRNDLAGEVGDRLRTALGAVICFDEISVRSVLHEIGPPEPMVTAIAQRIGAKPPPRPRINRTALIALGCGLLWLAGIGSMLAIVLGHKARVAIKLTDGRECGEGVAVGAIVTGLLGLGLPLLLGLA